MSKPDYKKMINGEYGSVVVTAIGAGNKYGTTLICKCKCGKLFEPRASSVIYGSTKTCGCSKKEFITNLGRSRATHGIYRKENRPYCSRWTLMIARCENPQLLGYKHYGAKGISVCERWHDFWLFMEDIKKMESESGLKLGPDVTLERKNGQLGYSPENVNLASRKEQNRNISTNHRIGGEIIADIEMETGISGSTITRLSKKGMTIEEIKAYSPAKRKSYLLDGRVISICEIARMCNRTADSVRWYLKKKTLDETLSIIGLKDMIGRIECQDTSSRYQKQKPTDS